MIRRFFAGKGGVGKTSLAAAHALAAAGRGRRVLVVSTDPAHSLGDALGRELGARPRRVPTGRGWLEAVELDADGALERWLGRWGNALRLLLGRGTYLDDEDVDRFLGLSLPGVDELVGLVELERLAGAGRYDEVVVNTAPTGHSLRLLATPEALGRLGGVCASLGAKHHVIAESLGGARRADATDDLIEELERQGRDLHEVLRDPARCRLTWVLLPEVLALEETLDGIAALGALGVHVDNVIVNRVTPVPARPCPRCRARLGAERAALAELGARLPGPRLRLVAERPEEPFGIEGLRTLGRAPRRLWNKRNERSFRTPDGAPAANKRNERSFRQPPAWLDDLAPPGVQLLIFGGKGGVGKTTCAAAAALALGRARPRQRVLLLSSDPAHSLADALASPLDDDERPLPGGPPRLRVRELSSERAFRALRERYQQGVTDVFDALLGLDAAYDRRISEQLIDLAPPGLDELVALKTLVDELCPAAGGRPAHDLVVLDSAPSGHTLRLLAMPEAAQEWVHALLATLYKHRRAVGLGELTADLLELAGGLRRLRALLADAERSRFVIVTRPGLLPRRESERLRAALRRQGVHVPAIVVNAIAPPPGCHACAREVAVGAREIDLLRRSRALRTARCAIFSAPSVHPPPRGLAALAAWSPTWTRYV